LFSGYSFPLNDEARLRQWLHAMKRKGFRPTKYSKLCSEHFKETDFMYQPGFQYKRLKKEAVPSVFAEFPEHLKKKKHTRTTKTSREAVSIMYCDHVAL
jgi:hypothetical protein